MREVKKTYFVYVLQSLKDHKHYCGLSSDVNARLTMHNSGKVRSTKSRRPFILIYIETVGSLRKAREREKYLKSFAGRKFLERAIEERKVSGSPPA